MQPKLESALLGAVVAVSLSLASAAMAADHRDAPTVDDYSAIDINDVFLFRDPPCTTANCTSQNFVLILSTQAVADPHFGVTYHFQPNALYRFNFSTTPHAIKNGIATARIDFTFSPYGNNDSCPAPQPPCQTYEATFPQGVLIDGPVTLGSNAKTPNEPVVTTMGPISIFAGPREDPFFFDLIGFNRFIAKFNSTGVADFSGQFTGVDAFLGKNINAIVVEFPINMLLPAGSTKLAVWAATFLGNLNLSNESSLEGLQQIDRMGNPAVNTALISTPLKDAFNFGVPKNDARDFELTIVENLIRYGVDQVNVLPALVKAGIPDTLKFDTTLPDGFVQVPPNGRQLADRTTDFELTLFFNVQSSNPQRPAAVTSCPVPVTAFTAFSDCTNPKTYLSTFPFAGPPLQQENTEIVDTP
jgi:hypothetical protein